MNRSFSVGQKRWAERFAAQVVNSTDGRVSSELAYEVGQIIARGAVQERTTQEQSKVDTLWDSYWEFVLATV
ncbi:hypothetical protein [Leptolyngbya sp. FACHB-261]|uniref:hypothetical protein n=1 Tax=Leptolyngbya sp. FACHB-261 TaxID=2692806 RepID=UPI0016878297|nr:hypothetical protein [Leptolyngbya sp. FACHB-261]MBD2104892.1 hypothetical protein [Leptolyngbya sp. FACHB-261]